MYWLISGTYCGEIISIRVNHLFFFYTFGCPQLGFLVKIEKVFD